MKTIVVLSHAPRRECEIDIPDGWYRVLSGSVKPGDEYLSATLFSMTGLMKWLKLTRFAEPGEPYSTADYFLCLIRQCNEVSKLCPICHDAAVATGYLYCPECCFQVARERKTAEEIRSEL